MNPFLLRYLSAFAVFLSIAIYPLTGQTTENGLEARSIQLEATAGVSLPFGRRSPFSGIRRDGLEMGVGPMVGLNMKLPVGAKTAFNFGLNFVNDRGVLPGYSKSIPDQSRPGGIDAFNENADVTRVGDYVFREDFLYFGSDFELSAGRFGFRFGFGINSMVGGRHTYNYTQTTRALLSGITLERIVLDEPLMAEGSWESDPLQRSYGSLALGMRYRIAERLSVNLMADFGLTFHRSDVDRADYFSRSRLMLNVSYGLLDR